jgi:alkylation response protein AidB-like acyl-CoA dehydrogenase
MDFRLTKEQIDIQKAAGEFAAGEFDPDLALKLDKEQHFPKALWERACSLGFIGLQYPEDCEGQGLGLLESVLVTEVFCRHDSGIGMALALSDFGAELVVKSGSEEQRRAVLPLIARGKGLLTAAVLEEGYSLIPFATRAVESDSGYRISGEKHFVTLGNLASFVIVACQNQGKEESSQSLFLIESTRPGLCFYPMSDKLGMRMVPIARAVMNEIFVPGTALIGGNGSGRTHLMHFLHAARIKAGAMGVGVAQGALDMSIDYSRKRHQFGKPIAAFNLIRNKLADMLVQVEMARLLVYRSACSLEEGLYDSHLSIMSKMAAVRTATSAASDAVQIHGGYGYTKEGRVERFYRDAKVLDLFLEPPQVQRELLADHVTGRPGVS